MKFWQEANKDKTETKFVFQNAPSPNGNEPNNPNAVSEERDREEAAENCSEETSNLCSEVVTAETIKKMPHQEQLELLLKFSKKEDKAEEDDQTWWDYLVVDAAKSVAKSTGIDQKTVINSLDFSDDVMVIKNISDSVKTNFMSSFQTQSFDLLTDNLGDNNYRAEFFGDSVLESRCNFNTMLKNKEEKHLIIGEACYTRTPRGYLAIFPQEKIGGRAKIFEGVKFSLTDKLPDGAARNLAELKTNEKNASFLGIDSPESAKKMENNRRNNFSQVSGYKSILSQLEKKLTPEDKAKHLDPFDDFLDANFYPDNILSESAGKSFKEVPGLDSLESPETFRKKMDEALEALSSGFAEEKIEEILYIKNSKEFTAQEKERTLTATKTEAKEVLKALEVAQADISKIQNISLEENKKEIALEVGIKNEDLEAVLEKFDEGLPELIKSGNISEETLLKLFNQAYAGVVGQGEEGKVSKEVKDKIWPLLKTRLDISLDQINQNATKNKLDETIYRTGIYVALKTEPEMHAILKENGINSLQDIDLNQLDNVLKSIEQYEDILKTQGGRSESLTKKITYLKKRVLELKAGMKVKNKKADEAEDLAKKANKDREKILDISERIADSKSEIGQKARKMGRILADAVRKQKLENPDEVALASDKLVDEVYQRVESGESEESIRESMGLPSKEENKNSETSTPIVSLENLPKGATNGKTLENGNLAFNVGETELEVNIATNMMFPRGTKGPQKDWLSFEAKSENTASVQLSSAMMGASVEDRQEGLGLMVRSFGPEGFRKLMYNLCSCQMGRPLDGKQIEGIQAIENNGGGMKKVFAELDLLRPDGQAAPEKAGQKSQEFFDILTSAAVGNFKKLEAPSSVKA